MMSMSMEMVFDPYGTEIEGRAEAAGQKSEPVAAAIATVPLIKTMYTKSTTPLMAAHTEDTSVEMSTSCTSQMEPEEQPMETLKRTESSPRLRHFCAHWLKKFRWLRHDKVMNAMFCTLCERQSHLGNSSFVCGNRSFRVLTIQVHEGSKEHQLSCMKTESEDLADNAVLEEATDATCNSVQDDKSGPSLTDDYDESAYTAKVKMSSCRYERHRIRHFCQHWLERFTWLRYDEATNTMYCTYCQEVHPQSNSSFVVGNSSFRVVAVQAHEASREHQRASVLFTTETGQDVRGPMDGPPDDSKEDIVKTEITSPVRRSATGVEGQRVRHFYKPWLTKFKWLMYNEELNAMFCRFCLKLQPKSCSSFVTGSRSFRIMSIRVHTRSREHHQATADFGDEYDDATSPAADNDTTCLSNGDGGGSQYASASRPGAEGLPEGLPEEFSEWTSQFPWLCYDTARSTLHCATCVAGGHDVHFPAASCSWQQLYSHLFSVTHCAVDGGLAGGGLAGDEVTASPRVTVPERQEKRRESCVQYETHRRVRRFLRHWLVRFPWLKYSRQQNAMFCRVCLRHRGAGTGGVFVRGSHSFRYPAIQAHAVCREHQRAMQADKLATDPHCSRKQTYLLQRHLAFYAWLQCHQGTLYCALCQAGQLSIDLDTETNAFTLVGQHAVSTQHLAAVQAEVDSWVQQYETEFPQAAGGSPSLAAFTTPAEQTTHIKAELVGDDSDQFSTAQLDLLHGSSSESSSVVVHAADHQGAGQTSSESDEMESEVETPSNVSQSHSAVVASTSKLVVRAFGAFRREWLTEFPWLTYDPRADAMRCQLCAIFKKKTSFARGVRMFSRSYVVAHMRQRKHLDAFAQMKEGAMADNAGNLGKMQVSI